MGTVPAPCVLGTVLSDPFGCFLPGPLVVSSHMCTERLWNSLFAVWTANFSCLHLPGFSVLSPQLKVHWAPPGLSLLCGLKTIQAVSRVNCGVYCVGFLLSGIIVFCYLMSSVVNTFKKKYDVGCLCLLVCCRWEGKSVYPVPEWKSPCVFFFFTPCSLRRAILFSLVFFKTLSFPTISPLLTIFSLPELPLFRCLHACISL